MIQIAHPEALLLIPLWGIAAWRLPRARLLNPLRILVALLFLFAALDLGWRRQTKGLDGWLLVDRSLSAQADVELNLPEMEALLEGSRGRHDRLHVMEFAEESMLRGAGDTRLLTGARDRSRLGAAIQSLLLHTSADREHRVLLLSDGQATDSLELASEQLLAAEIPLHLRLLRPDPLQDVAADYLQGPLRVRPGDAFILEGELRGEAGREVEVSLSRNGTLLETRRVTLEAGPTQVRWTDRLPDGLGAVEYQLLVESEGDPLPANNLQQHWVEVKGNPVVLLATSYPDDPLAGLLQRGGMRVRLVTETFQLRPADLSAASAVILNNVHASRFQEEFLDALPFFVKEQGGGLMMVGGKNSFGSGGYFESSVDELLPVSMELKEEDRKLAVAMAIVMDRSGSMSASVGGSTKMDLANSGAARALELLGDMDALTVYAVDTAAHEIMPLVRVGSQRQRLASAIRRIQSTGGGIYVRTGLEAGWNQLKGAPQGQKHIILFSDAADSEEQQGVPALVQRMTSVGATVSVIALGQPTDPDAAFLEQTAQQGGGRVFFTTDAGNLPKIFAQETVSVSRSAFLEEPVELELQPGWRELSPQSLEWLKQVDGYNLSYLRDGATISLRSMDDYAAPLLAQWQRGQGRVAAVSFPLAGDFSQSQRDWAELPDFAATLSRWLLRPELPPGLTLRNRRVGETLQVDLYADEQWQDRFGGELPLLKTQVGSEAVREQVWRRVEPGRLQSTVELRGGELMRGALQLGGNSLPFGPLSGVGGEEWKRRPERLLQVRALAEASGGGDLLDVESFWVSTGRMRVQGLQLFWLTLCLILFLIEALWERLDGSLPSFAHRQEKAPKAKKEKAPKEPEADPEPKRDLDAEARRRRERYKAARMK